MRQHPFDKLYIQIHKRGIFFCKGKSDNISTSADLTLFHVSMKVSVKFLCFSQSSSSLASLRSVVLQGIDFEIRYLAGIRFIDTAKYQGRMLWLLRMPLLLLFLLLPLFLSCFHMSNDSNLLNSLLRVEEGNEATYLY